MSYTQPLSRTWIEKLMEISTALGDYTHTTTQCTRIPNYLSRALNLGPVTLAIIDASVDNTPRIALMTSSLDAGVNEDAALSNGLLSLYQSTLAAPAGAAEEDSSSDVLQAVLPMAIPGFPSAQVFAQEIDATHRMLLIVHQHQEAAEAVEEVRDTLVLVAGQLSKLLRCMVACSSGSNILGGRFNRLTEREWMVLRVLNSEDGEKQLADRLSLSPHTLHSHIKSIYRKVGVQGRLSLLLRLREAQQDLRLATLTASREESRLEPLCA